MHDVSEDHRDTPEAEGTAEVRNATPLSSLNRKHQLSPPLTKVMFPTFYLSPWECSCVIPVQSCWDSKFKITSDSFLKHPFFLSVCFFFFFTSMKWRLVFFRGGNYLLRMACQHHEFYMTEYHFHPKTYLNLSSLVIRILILQPEDVAHPTRSPGTGSD